MAFVIDATTPWRFADESTPWTEALLDRLEGGEEVWFRRTGRWKY